MLMSGAGAGGEDAAKTCVFTFCARLPQCSSCKAAPLGATTPRFPTFTCQPRYSVYFTMNQIHPSIKSLF